MTNYIPQIAKINKRDRFNAITKVLTDNGIPYVVQELSSYNALGNIVVSYNLNSNQKKLAITAHYDNAPGTPGANDNAAACSILLNLILAVKEKGSDKSLEFVFFDKEEHGFAGSIHYRRENRDLLLGVLNLDMCGMGSNTLISLHNGGEKLLSQPLPDDVHVLRILPPGDAYFFINSGVPTVYIINSTDNDIPWFETYAVEEMFVGMPDFRRTMHQPTDTPDTCNLAQVEKIFQFVYESAIR